MLHEDTFDCQSIQQDKYFAARSQFFTSILLAVIAVLENSAVQPEKAMSLLRLSYYTIEMLQRVR
ncbi:MAG: hypothetical protein ACRCZS_22660 [Chroococcidiopsis sp.]